jgi:hypothetical protein
MAEQKKKKKPHLKLIQGGKSDKKQAPKPAPKMAAENPTKRVHPFAHFFEKPRNVTSAKPNSREQTMSHQIPRKKAV